MLELMRVLTHEGVVAVEVTDSAMRSAVGNYWNAVRRFLDTGDMEDLREFEDVEINGHTLVTDPHFIESWAAQGELEFEQIYDSSGQ